MKIIDPRVGRIAGYKFYYWSILDFLNNQQKEVRMPCGSKKPTTKKPPKK